jgi:hypothetical protein
LGQKVGQVMHIKAWWITHDVETRKNACPKHGLKANIPMWMSTILMNMSLQIMHNSWQACLLIVTKKIFLIKLRCFKIVPLAHQAWKGESWHKESKIQIQSFFLHFKTNGLYEYAWIINSSQSYH